VNATEMLAAPLDRSVARIAGPAADARNFDRREVVDTSDVWDNNTYPFFAVALTRLPWLRERRARTALRWMGAASSDWMISIAGPPVERFPGPSPTLTDILDPPDLTGAAITSFRLERTGPTLTGFLGLRLPDGPVGVTVEDVRTVQFDSADTTGVTVSDSGSTIGLGTRGTITASRASSATTTSPPPHHRSNPRSQSPAKPPRPPSPWPGPCR
jgi:hypothetical protein